MLPPVRALALVFVLVLAFPPHTFAKEDSAGFALYAAHDQDGVFRPLDPLSLASLDREPSLPRAGEWPLFAVSADGSTFVSIDPSQGPLNDWVTVRDGAFGDVRTRITTEAAVYAPRLSADGSRLVVVTNSICGPAGCDPRTFYTYETRTGNLISTTSVALANPVWPDMLSPAGDRLYVPFHDRPAPSANPPTPVVPGQDPGPWPLQIAVFDLGTGQEVKRTTVPDVMVGSWHVSSTDDMYLGAHVIPGIALSPDGTRIAVADALSDRLTLLDTATLEPVATLEIHEREGLAGRVLEWLGLAPQSASAKVSEGTQLSAAFASDGRSLYLTGSEITVGETYEDIEGRGRGLARIDLATGEILGTALADADIQAIIVAPDARSVYVLRTDPPWWAGSEPQRLLLQRMDAETLEPRAERSFEAWVQVMLVPQARPAGTLEVA